MDNGWIKIHRKTTEWGWYKHPVTSRLWFHLLMKANHNDGVWFGQEVKRGQLITGRKVLAQELGVSEQSIRSSINHLKSTNEITIKSTNKYSLITINSWNDYQLTNQQTNQQLTSNQPTTNHKQEEEELKKNKNITNISKDISAKAVYGREDINGMLLALKKTIGIDAFADSKIERNMAKHCVGLIAKIGKDEFKRRLIFLLSDEFTAKNCNKIKFVYNNIKAFKEPTISSNTIRA